MNVCAQYRKEIALVASDPNASELPSGLGRHIAQCPRCREYWGEIKALCVLCTSVAEGPNASLSPDFHNAWLNQTREPDLPAISRVFPSFANSRMRIGVALAGVVLLIAALSLLHRPEPDPPDSASTDITPSNRPSNVTLLDYRLAASDADLDSLLRQDMARSFNSGETYTMLTRSEEETF